jgi:UDP-N-acetylmuramate: L-alanyl-gamma-D-glutamyl-meso-diaminopimelate ligase
MSAHIYFLGIGGTLMGSLAQLARERGYRVSGSDRALYPPMSEQLAAADITLYEGFDPSQLDPAPDLVVVGNAGLPRGHPGIEHVLDIGLPYMSGAEWLGREILPGRWVLAVAGTHGKTTTASMLTWILEQAGLEPGYLIGGVPKNFERSARLGATPFFNNLEFDHADIFPDLAAIQTQFHQLMRTVPGGGLVIAPADSEGVNEMLDQGCWTPIERVGQRQLRRRPHDRDSGVYWHADEIEHDQSAFDVWQNDRRIGRIKWSLQGEHNIQNALGALAAARHAGVPPEIALEALASFEGVRRRMDVIADVRGTIVYDDFAHHPTAIRATLQGLRRRVGNEEIIAVVEPRTHTMSLGTLRHELTTCCAAADQVFWFRGENIKWDLHEVVQHCVVPAQQFDSIDRLVDTLARLPDKRRHILIMSNGSFGGIYSKLPARLREYRQRPEQD